LEEIARQLLKRETDVTMKDSDERTALHWAAEKRHEAVVKLLLEKEEKGKKAGGLLDPEK
jgi:ankyrin repeat protein